WISASPESIVVKMEPDIKWPSPRLVRTRRWSGELRAIRVDSTPSSLPEAADLAILSCFVMLKQSAEQARISPDERSSRAEDCRFGWRWDRTRSGRRRAQGPRGGGEEEPVSVLPQALRLRGRALLENRRCASRRSGRR